MGASRLPGRLHLPKRYLLCISTQVAQLRGIIPLPSQSRSDTMQAVTVRASARTVAPARASVKCTASHNEVCQASRNRVPCLTPSLWPKRHPQITWSCCVQVKVVARRDLIASGATFAAFVLGANSAKAAGESSATRAITAVTRPKQLQKK